MLLVGGHAVPECDTLQNKAGIKPTALNRTRLMMKTQGNPVCHHKQTQRAFTRYINQEGDMKTITEVFRNTDLMLPAE